MGRRARPGVGGAFAAAALLALFFAASAARAQTTTTTLNPVADAWLRQQAPTTPQAGGTGTTIWMEPGKRQSLVQFDLSSLPAANYIVSATLRLYVTQNSTDGGLISAHRATTSWTEATATWTNMQANYDATVVGTGNPATLNQYADVGVTSLVKAWKSGTTNDGFMLLLVGGASTTTYGSREAAAGTRPELVVVVRGDPVYSITKLSQVVSDPANGSTQPKRMPGSVIQYSVTVASTNANVPDADTVALVEAVPAQTSLYVGDLGAGGSGPVAFTNGSPSSTLTFTYSGLASATDDLRFSSDGGGNFNYTPVPDADGYDSAVTHLRIAPKGTFLGSTGGGNPSFSYAFRAKNK
jgi:hypothetical protein